MTSLREPKPGETVDVNGIVAMLTKGMKVEVYNPDGSIRWRLTVTGATMLHLRQSEIESET